MSKFREIAVLILCIELLLCAFCNLQYSQSIQKEGGRIYRVETSRVAMKLKELWAEQAGADTTEAEARADSAALDLSALDLSEYPHILAVSVFDEADNCNDDYVVTQVGSVLYRITYVHTVEKNFPIMLNMILVFVVLLSAVGLVYLDRRLLTPFQKMTNLPAELAKGNLSIPLQEEKTKFFGKFLWGLDMLRETLEEQKQTSLALVKEKKTVVLSLSHDIKTPLSAIELYTKALGEQIYDTEEKRQEAYEGILRNTEQIKDYVNRISEASREEFLHLSVNCTEFYLNEMMEFVEQYYQDKLDVLQVQFVCEKTPICLVKGDKERAIEVLQNVIENALKYGDGGKIEISYEEEEDCKLVTVTNTETAIPKEELPHLFDSFYRGSNAKQVKGSGLGLYICKSLMKQMDGDIFAAVDKDCFHMTIVLRKA